MNKENLLEGKKILVVDDESDILDTVAELLSMCEVEKASTFDEAWERLGTQYYDLVILDIMGVQGYRLLELANERKVPAMMLTAHAMTPDNVVKSHQEGAAYFLPKDEMVHIASHLNDILEAKQEGKSTWWRWLDRLGAFFDARFGPDWQADHQDFWKHARYF
jgi:CheY-like chemotaxis protein